MRGGHTMRRRSCRKLCSCFFSRASRKGETERKKAEEERKAKKEQQKQLNAKFDKRFTLNVSKNCTANFKSQTRDFREKVMSQLDSQGNGAPEVGKYNPKLDQLRK